MGTVKKRHTELANTQAFCVLQTEFDTVRKLCILSLHIFWSRDMLGLLRCSRRHWMYVVLLHGVFARTHWWSLRCWHSIWPNLLYYGNETVIQKVWWICCWHATRGAKQRIVRKHHFTSIVAARILACHARSATNPAQAAKAPRVLQGFKPGSGYFRWV